MFKGTTKSGYKFEIDERVKDDWRLLQAIADSESEDASIQIKGVSDLVNLFIGPNKTEFMKYISDNNGGFIPRTAVIAEITDMINSLNELKN